MLHTIEHPLIADELTRLRDPACPSPEFRQRVRRIASLMVPAVTADLETTVVPCNTPLEITSGVKLTRGIILVPILRAGLGFLDGFLDLIPHASVAHIGLARNENTLAAGILLSEASAGPGGAGSDHPRSRCSRPAARRSKRCAVCGRPGRVTFGSPVWWRLRRGFPRCRKRFPDLAIYAACVDRCLNSCGYILPGLGDAGDRLFGTSA